ncbi:MAG: DUF6316 family protein [Pseudomonadales bacterium]
MNNQETLPRSGEPIVHHVRSGRCRKMGDKWFTRTREGKLMGPFRDRTTAEFASRNLADFMVLAPRPIRKTLEHALQLH